MTAEQFRRLAGRRGSTQVRLAGASTPALREALASAWRNVAPKRLRHDPE